MPRVVWAEESKTGLRFEIRPSYDAVPTRSQFVTDGQSSCMKNESSKFELHRYLEKYYSRVLQPKIKDYLSASSTDDPRKKLILLQIFGQLAQTPNWAFLCSGPGGQDLLNFARSCMKSTDQQRCKLSLVAWIAVVKLNQ